jgi:hypothetical protein
MPGRTRERALFALQCGGRRPRLLSWRDATRAHAAACADRLEGRMGTDDALLAPLTRGETPGGPAPPGTPVSHPPVIAGALVAIDC